MLHSGSNINTFVVLVIAEGTDPDPPIGVGDETDAVYHPVTSLNGRAGGNRSEWNIRRTGLA